MGRWALCFNNCGFANVSTNFDFHFSDNICNCSHPVYPSPGLAILNLKIYLILSSLKVVLTHILLSARLTILRHWKSNNLPTMSEVISTTHLHFTYKIMFASAKGFFTSVYLLYGNHGNTRKVLLLIESLCCVDSLELKMFIFLI